MGNKVSVLCKLPQGCILEGGYYIKDGGVYKTDKYFRIEIKGANQHSREWTEGDRELRTPSPKDLEPGITHNVDEELFDEWVKSHADTNIVKHGLVVKVAGAKKEVKAVGVDLTAQKTGMEAVDPTQYKGVKKFNPGDETAINI